MDIKQIYDLIGDATPIKRDCGVLCGKRCCVPDEDGQGGVFLIPEAESAKDMKWADIVNMNGRPMLMCRGACDREKRPFACRIFPLSPYRNREGEWLVRVDSRADAVCPVVRSGIRGMSTGFVHAVGEAVKEMAGYPEGEAFLRQMEGDDNAFRQARKSLEEQLGL